MTPEKILTLVGLILAVPSAVTLLVPLGVQYSDAALWAMAIALPVGMLVLLSALIVKLTRSS